MTHYQVLGVDPSADAEIVTAAWRAAAKKHHPDQGGSDPEKLQAIGDAYEVLRDPQSRKAYDIKLDQDAASNVGEYTRTETPTYMDVGANPYADPDAGWVDPFDETFGSFDPGGTEIPKFMRNRSIHKWSIVWFVFSVVFQTASYSYGVNGDVISGTSGQTFLPWLGILSIAAMNLRTMTGLLLGLVVNMYLKLPRKLVRPFLFMFMAAYVLPIQSGGWLLGIGVAAAFGTIRLRALLPAEQKADGWQAADF